MKRSKSQPSHLDALKLLTLNVSAPSIPTKFQSFGYEEAEDGNLRLQEPLRPGFSGLKNDQVGPGDYDPQIIDSKHPRAPVSLFHKVILSITLFDSHLIRELLAQLANDPTTSLAQDTIISNLLSNPLMMEHLMAISIFDSVKLREGNYLPSNQQLSDPQ